MGAVGIMRGENEKVDLSELLDLIVSESYDPSAVDTRVWVDGAPVYPDSFNVLRWAAGDWEEWE